MSIVMCNSDDPSIDMYVAERCEHFPMLHIRPARVEDADDLMPIFTQYSAEVNEEYGKIERRATEPCPRPRGQSLLMWHIHNVVTVFMNHRRVFLG